MTSRSRLLVVARHAQAASWAASDEERPLTAAGEAAAADAGRWLAAGGFVPELAHVSTAVRTRTTWERMAASAGWDLAPRLDGGLYAAGPEAALDVVRLQTPEDAGAVVLLGHNPTVATLAQLLDDGDGDTEAATAVLGGFPPAALVLLRVDVGWADLGEGTCRLLGFHVGRG